jgi:hypothetical protein
MLPLPSKEELNKVIKERETERGKFKPGFYDGDNPSLYIDKKGLIHNGGPKGEIVSYKGWTKDQLASLGEERIMPMPR